MTYKSIAYEEIKQLVEYHKTAIDKIQQSIEEHKKKIEQCHFDVREHQSRIEAARTAYSAFKKLDEDGAFDIFSDNVVIKKTRTSRKRSASLINRYRQTFEAMPFGVEFSREEFMALGSERGLWQDFDEGIVLNRITGFLDRVSKETGSLRKIRRESGRYGKVIWMKNDSPAVGSFPLNLEVA